MAATKGFIVLRATQLLAAILFVLHMNNARESAVTAWLPPLIVILLIIFNSIRFTRFVAWIIFAVSFFGFLVLLSAFTLRWRLEPGFSSTPFYIAICMYITFIYVSLAQIKLLTGHSHASGNPEPNKPGSPPSRG